MKELRCIIAMVILGLGPTAWAAQVDKRGAVDHPLISRFPDTYISGYHTSEFQELLIAVGPTTPELLAEEGKTALPPVKRYEGKSTVITYKAKKKSNSALAIFRNFEKAFKANGFAKTFSCKSDAECGPRFAKQLYWYGDPARQGQNPGLDAPNTHGSKYTYFYWTGIGKAETGDYLVSLLVAQQANASFPATIVLDVSEVEALDEDRISINLEGLQDDMRANGKVVLDGVFFDFDKSTLTVDSSTTISIIAGYLKANRGLSFYVVGHTDSKGSLEYNQSLSGSRAEAVVDALTASHGIDQSRLQAFGVGPVSPVTSNSTEEGRVLNRRVEMVLKD